MKKNNQFRIIKIIAAIICISVMFLLTITAIKMEQIPRTTVDTLILINIINILFLSFFVYRFMYKVHYLLLAFVFLISLLFSHYVITITWESNQYNGSALLDWITEGTTGFLSIFNEKSIIFVSIIFLIAILVIDFLINRSTVKNAEYYSLPLFFLLNEELIDDEESKTYFKNKSSMFDTLVFICQINSLIVKFGIFAIVVCHSVIYLYGIAFSQDSFYHLLVNLFSNIFGCVILTVIPLLLLSVAIRLSVSLPRNKKAKSSKEEQSESKYLYDRITIEIGLGLMPIAEEGKGEELPKQVLDLRKKLSSENSITVPNVRIVDNDILEPYQYRITSSYIGEFKKQEEDLPKAAEAITADLEDLIIRLNGYWDKTGDKNEKNKTR